MAEYDIDRNDDLPRRAGGGSGGMKTVLLILAAVALVGLCCIGSAVGLMFWGVSSVREAASRMHSSNNMMQITMAFHNYHDTYGTFPKAALKTTDGRPGLSWRVTLLPFLEEDDLYKQFKLDEPWDSPNNIKLLEHIPITYASPGEKGGTTTHYRVFVGNGALFDHDKALRTTDVTDGLSNTIAVVEATGAVPWTKPDELEYNPNGPLPPLGLPQRKGVLVAMADGSIHIVRRGLEPAIWRRAIEYNDGQKVGDEFFGLK